MKRLSRPCEAGHLAYAPVQLTECIAGRAGELMLANVPVSGGTRPGKAMPIMNRVWKFIETTSSFWTGKSVRPFGILLSRIKSIPTH